MFVPGKFVQPSIMFAGKVNLPEVLLSWVGSWPYMQSLDSAGKAHQGQTR